MVSIRDLSFYYNRRQRHAPVIDNLSLDIEEGRVYGLLGPNGSGKSTLIYLIAGLLTPRSGCVEFNGVDTRLRLPSTLSSIMVVAEELSLPSMPLSEYVKLYSRFYPNFSHEDMRRNLELFEIDESMNLGECSMGQKKKAYICFALAANTPLLLMDEPTNGLDIPGKIQFRKFIVSNMTDDRTVIISSHQVRDIDLMLDNVIMLNNEGVMLNCSIADLAQSLLFVDTADPAVIKQSLYAVPSIGGMSVILPNVAGEPDTRVNLETLFALAQSQPQLLDEIINNSSSVTSH